MSKMIDKKALMDDLKAWKATYDKYGYSQHEYAINGVIARLESGRFDIIGLETCKDCCGEGVITVENFNDPESFLCPTCDGVGSVGIEEVHNG